MASLSGTTKRRATFFLWYGEWKWAYDSTHRLIYTDNLHGKADTLQVTLEDGDFRWRKAGFPAKGDWFAAYVVCENWFAPGDTHLADWGEFQVENPGISGPPHQARVRAVSIPVTKPIRGEEKSHTWTERTVKVIAQEIAYDNGLALVWHPTTEGTMFRVIPQRNESDFTFLKRVAADSGFNVKIGSNRLIVTKDAQLVAKAPPRETVIPLEKTLISYSLSTKSTDTYKACKVTWFDNKKKQLITDTFEPEGGPVDGPILKIEIPVQDQAEALEQAKASLARKNKNMTGGTLVFVGDPRLRAGHVLPLEGFYGYDGDYLIEQAVHARDARGAYTTTVKVRKYLGYE